MSSELVLLTCKCGETVGCYRETVTTKEVLKCEKCNHDACKIPRYAHLFVKQETKCDDCKISEYYHNLARKGKHNETNSLTVLSKS